MRYGYALRLRKIKEPSEIIEIVAGSGLYSEYLMIYNLDLDRKHYPNRNNSLQSARALIDILNNTLDNTEK